MENTEPETHDLKDRSAILEQYVKFNPRILEMDQQSEALKIASEIELAITCGFIGSAEQYDRLLLSAVSQLRALHARVEELVKDRGNAKRLVSKIWDKHPEARETIEEGTGAWLVFGQDVETGGVSAHRVTQAEDHIAQDRKMVAAQEPFGYFKQDTYGWMDCSKDADGAIALYKAPQPQADAQDAQRYRWLIDYFISDRVDLDDAIVAAKTSEDIAKIIDAAIAAAKGALNS